ncbi:hypothetical protein PQX77_012252 [Marasmius sp. AFHP31]|nr:hypothetical protein PQX77_012252 [Marasmius sp. AFHP31]
MKFSAVFCTLLSIATVALAHNGTDTSNEKRQLASVITSCTAPNTVALTFDDGPYDYIYDIANRINDAGGKATFFFNGNNWRCIYNFVDAIRYVHSQGHQLASHTWSHGDLNTMNRAQLNQEFEKVEVALKRIAGVTPAFMRPPFGNYNNLVRQVAAARGQKVVIWDFDSRDSASPRPSAGQMRSDYGHLLWDVRPNNVLALNHEFNHDTVYEVMGQVVEWCQQRGYRMVTVAECLGQQPYQNVGQPENGSNLQSPDLDHYLVIVVRRDAISPGGPTLVLYLNEIIPSEEKYDTQPQGTVSQSAIEDP